MNNRKKINTLIALMLLAALLGLVMVYPSLPDIIPTHWGPDGQVDGTGPKSMLFLFFAIVAGGNGLMLFAEKIDPRGENYAKFSKVFEIFRLVFTVFMIMMMVVNVYFAFNPGVISINKIIMPAMGIMFAVLGNYMPKVKHNYTFGIKTPWTLASETVWNKTHRMAGPLWVAGGILTALCGFIPGDKAAVAMVVFLVVEVVVPTGYSYIAFNKEKAEKEKEN